MVSVHMAGWHFLASVSSLARAAELSSAELSSAEPSSAEPSSAKLAAIVFLLGGPGAHERWEGHPSLPMGYVMLVCVRTADSRDANHSALINNTPWWGCESLASSDNLLCHAQRERDQFHSYQSPVPLLPRPTTRMQTDVE
ncbi:uncharacterized protein Tco025E_00691 [Trypanosoma conorhini]|uniref:Secreted protein n=1 Tax=Trypanosoma conorhini TaxID=83891 RepID=A0A3R7LLH6_9TRYP|nr:uncharacterized protein Tco025E_00691 [Trypanosoma conorhini]RNF27054.1 hypothetical protein Tco025E_00691 [Trypanosoma conorhini]